jgi:hypothetical protein
MNAAADGGSIQSWGWRHFAHHPWPWKRVSAQSSLWAVLQSDIIRVAGNARARYARGDAMRSR